MFLFFKSEIFLILKSIVRYNFNPDHDNTPHMLLYWVIMFEQEACSYLALCIGEGTVGRSI